MKRRYSVCSFCGRKGELPADGPPCVMLEGWLTVLYWKGLGSVEQHDFCSHNCLGRWAQAQGTQVPDIFLESFKEEPEGGDTSL